MPGLGTIINMAAIVLGGLLGLVSGSFLNEKIQSTLNLACGLSVIFLGIGGVMENMLSVEGGALSSGGSLMMIASMVIGSLIGTLLDIEGKLERFGEWLKKKSGSSGDNRFTEAFLTATFTVCIGAMAVIGSIRDGIYGDYSILAAKSVLDAIIVMVMSASMGKGCLFSAIPVGIFQGSVTLLARLAEPLMTEAALANLSYTGSMLIFCIGVNLIWGKKFPVADMLPAIFVAVAWAFLPF